ncbi:GNAT family N-acetyltransferase [Nocardia sp. NPDC058518]|uniref:GNAT family N-acetyltransferase n=1 Tax=Nocardia sp. NPDC058518 TaxID=3346534 RepID=UPI00364A5237
MASGGLIVARGGRNLVWHADLVVQGIVVDQITREPAHLRELLTDLDALHQLRDGHFAASKNIDGSDPHLGRLVAARDGQLEGFLAGNPRTGHIALIGVRNEGAGVGTALLDAFLRHARAVASTEITVVLDTEPHGRWRRRAFFEARMFTASPGSHLHFHRGL